MGGCLEALLMGDEDSDGELERDWRKVRWERVKAKPRKMTRNLKQRKMMRNYRQRKKCKKNSKRKEWNLRRILVKREGIMAL